MSGELAVDTSAVIAYREGVRAVCALIEGADVLFIPAIVLGELLYGAANSSRPQENEKAVRAFLAQCVLVPVDGAIAARYAAIRFALKKAARPIPENDLWVAATCLELDAALLTRDGHFDHVRGLAVLNWTREKGKRGLQAGNP